MVSASQKVSQSLTVTSEELLMQVALHTKRILLNSKLTEVKENGLSQIFPLKGFEEGCSISPGAGERWQ